MNQTFNKAEELAGVVKEYLNTRIEIIKLGIAEKTAAVIATLVAGAIALLVFMGFIVFAGVAVAVAIGEWSGKMWLGFTVMAFTYLLIALIAWTGWRKAIRASLVSKILQQLGDENK